MPKHNAKSLLEQLTHKGLLTGSDKASDFIISTQKEERPPLYMAALVFVGALITSLSFVALIKGLVSSPTSFFFVGLFAVAIACAIQPNNKIGGAFANNFTPIISLALMISGKYLLWTFLLDQIGFHWAAIFLFFIIVAVTYQIYQVPIERFISSFSMSCIVLVKIIEYRDKFDLMELLLNGFFLVQFACAAILLTHGKIKRDYIPLAYALVFSLCLLFLQLARVAASRYVPSEELISLYFVNLVLVCGLIALLGWVAGDMAKLKTEPLLLASIGAMLLGVISAPGIILAISLLILGYAKHDKFLTIVGILLMPIFLWLYYYNVEVSFLQKSGLLMGGGIVLLAGRFYLRHRGWAEGGT